MHITMDASVQTPPRCASNSKSEVICPLSETVWHRVPELGDLSWAGLVDIALSFAHLCVQSQLKQPHRKLCFFYSIRVISQVSKLPGNGGKFPTGLSSKKCHFFCSHSISTTIILWTKPLTSESSLFRYHSSIVKNTQKLS